MRRVILNFHGIGEPKRPLEPGEERYWVSEDFFSQTLVLMDRVADRVETHLTFDDGNASDIEIAAPLLARHNRTASFFVLSGRLDTDGSLSAADLREMRAAGHQIGTHGADHVDWRALDSAGQAREWDHARARLAEAIGAPVNDAAIPFGRYRGGVMRNLKKRGYGRIYSSDGGSWKKGDNPIPRTSPRYDLTMTDIEDILLGNENFGKRVRRRLAMTAKRWV